METNTKPTGAELIAAERRRQIEQEGYNAEHDRGHIENELAYAAIAYAEPRHRLVKKNPGDERYAHLPTMTVKNKKGVEETFMEVPNFWPWDMASWKPTPNDRIRELTKAGALIAAEIDRLQAKK